MEVDALGKGKDIKLPVQLLRYSLYRRPSPYQELDGKAKEGYARAYRVIEQQLGHFYVSKKDPRLAAQDPEF